MTVVRRGTGLRVVVGFAVVVDVVVVVVEVVVVEVVLVVVGRGVTAMLLMSPRRSMVSMTKPEQDI